jgi:hypothetical protein
VTRRKRPNPYINMHFKFEGKQYRICFCYQTIMLVAVRRRPGARGEYVLKHMSRRWKKVVQHFRSQPQLADFVDPALNTGAPIISG